MTYILAALAIALGAAGLVYGGADDSPGAQLMGVVIIVGAVALCVRTVRRGRMAARSSR
jgi:hypothetical protein